MKNSEKIMELTGTWKFLRSELVDVDGNQLDDPLNNGEGIILYTKNYMSAQLTMSKELNEEQAKYTNQEYVAYTGAYTFDSEAQIVTHHIQMANFPDAVGRSVERKVIKIDADHIILGNVKPESFGIGTMIYRKLWWERVE